MLTQKYHNNDTCQLERRIEKANSEHIFQIVKIKDLTQLRHRPWRHQRRHYRRSRRGGADPLRLERPVYRVSWRQRVFRFSPLTGTLWFQAQRML